MGILQSIVADYDAFMVYIILTEVEMYTRWLTVATNGHGTVRCMICDHQAVLDRIDAVHR